MREYSFKAGDIIGFSGAHVHSDFINVSTYGIPRRSISHVGIIAGSRGNNLLYEAVGTGVRACLIIPTIKMYNGRIWVYPLYRNLYPHESRRLRESLIRELAVPYDVRGAIRAGGFIFSHIESLFWKQDFSSFFCSELVASKISEIGIFPITNASRWSPNMLVRKLRREGIVHKPVRLK